MHYRSYEKDKEKEINAYQSKNNQQNTKMESQIKACPTWNNQFYQTHIDLVTWNDETLIIYIIYIMVTFQNAYIYQDVTWYPLQTYVYLLITLWKAGKNN